MGAIHGFDSRRVAADLLAIVAVAVLLVGIHVLVPPGVRADLVLTYPAPNPFDALTAAYVHADDAHLVGNVVGYLAGAGVAYLLSLGAGERRWFHLSWLAILTVLPIAVGLTTAAVVDRPVTGRGFSGVVAGFAGFVLVGAGVVLHRAFGVDRQLSWQVVGALSLVVAAEILWLATDASPPLLVGLLVVGVGLPLAALALRGVRTGGPPDRDGWVRLGGAVLVTGLVLAVVSWFVLGLFPTDLVGERGVTNVLAHYLGLVSGGLIAAWGYRYWSVEPRNRRS